MFHFELKFGDYVRYRGLDTQVISEPFILDGVWYVRLAYFEDNIKVDSIKEKIWR